MRYKLEHKTNKKISRGLPEPLGATVKEDGVNFAIFSQYAKDIYLLLFDRPEGLPSDIIKLENKTEHIWHVFVHGIKQGQLYGYKVDGPYDPAEGMRFNKYKLLIDPYAKAVTGKCYNKDNLLLGYNAASPKKDLIMDKRDNTLIMPKAIVVDDSAFDWQGDTPLDIPLDEIIIYEVHVKGFTRHISSRVKNRGTYLGFIEKIPYLKQLGITSVELMPIHESCPQDFLIKKGLSDYWGYNSIGYFAPESSYSTGRFLGCQVNEFKTLVRELHKAGIEVILDVVYNHTGESDRYGPTVCFRGIDNPSYYALEEEDGKPYLGYKNDTGCGNTINAENPYIIRFILDSLRYWREVMHVDGFRFDLASILARKCGQFSKDSIFFSAIANDTILSKVKMIAEPWDMTTYQVGNFPVSWSEWNGKFRDTVRRFLKGDPGQLGDLGRRLTGSADLYNDDGRLPHNSINFITCHDGFTLNDLYSYNKKHNRANGENNRDGMNENYSWNCGVEGPTKNPKILKLRRQMVKNAFCFLFFSLGTPMMLHGDEILRTKKGNNNSYCQDNKINWINWWLVKKNADILEFCKKAIIFRKTWSVLKRKRFFTEQYEGDKPVPGVDWYGTNLDYPDWDNPEKKILSCKLDGRLSPYNPGNYELFFIMNADEKYFQVKLPQIENMRWYRVIDTSLDYPDDFLDNGDEKLLKNTEYYNTAPHTTVALLAK